MGFRPAHSDPDVTTITFNPKDTAEWSKRVDEFLDRKSVTFPFYGLLVAIEVELYIRLSVCFLFKMF